MLSNEYIAGFFDGEGCVRITINKDTTSGIHIFITNTYKPILDLIKDKFGGIVSLRTNSNEKHKTQYQWRISNKTEAIVFIDSIIEFSIEKKDQLLFAKEYCLLPKLKVNKFTKNNLDVLSIKEKRKELASKIKDLKYLRS